jgi:hypothetical protein
VKLLRRGSAIEPSPLMPEPLAHSLATDHMKNDGRLTRCPLKGIAGPSWACKHAREGNGCPLRCPLRLRLQHPHDPQASEGLFAPQTLTDHQPLSAHPRANSTYQSRAERPTGRMMPLFSSDCLLFNLLFDQPPDHFGTGR